MRLTIRLPHKTEYGNIPVCWDQVTWRQFMQLAEAKDRIQELAIVTNLDEGLIRRAIEIKGLDHAMSVISFLRRPCPTFVPHKILFYPLPKDLGFETVAQYEDIRSTLEKLKDEKDQQKILAQYPYFVAVYACKHMSRERCEALRESTGNDEIKYGEYHWQKAEAMVEDFMNSPAPEVLGIGNFIMVKFWSLNMGINLASLRTLTPAKRLKLVIKRWVLRLDLKERFIGLLKRLGKALKLYNDGAPTSSITQ
jgi:hypothetical protein